MDDLIKRIGKSNLCKNFAASILDNAEFWDLTFTWLQRKFEPTFWKNWTGYQNVPYFWKLKAYWFPQKHVFYWFYSLIVCDLLYWTSCIFFFGLNARTGFLNFWSLYQSFLYFIYVTDNTLSEDFRRAVSM